MAQGKARPAGNGPALFKGRNAALGHVLRFPSGEPLAGHLRCCALLKGDKPSLRGRALHLTGQRLAEGRLVGKWQS